jgi:Leucine-rich repeat (LRR) protein
VSFASFEAMRTNAHACRAVAPVEAVTVRWPRKREATTDLSPIAELRELSLTGKPNDEDEIGWLADSPQLSTLRSLTARGLWTEGLALLVASPHLARLKVLRLPANNMGNPGLLTLVDAAALTALEELDLSGRGRSGSDQDPSFRSGGLQSLARWKGLATVRSLTLSDKELGRDGLRTLLRSAHVGALKELSLRSCRLDGQAMGELGDALPALRLETLDLGENVLKELGVAYLASAPCLRELKALYLDRCEVPLPGARQLAKARFLDGLRLLDVGHNHFGPVGLGALLEREPPSLHTLRMSDNDLFDKGSAVLAGSPASDNLLEADLSRNGLGDAAAQALGESAHLRGLLVLRLTGNRISDSAAAGLAASPLGQRLALLDVPPARPNPPPPEDEIPF